MIMIIIAMRSGESIAFLILFLRRHDIAHI